MGKRGLDALDGSPIIDIKSGEEEGTEDER